MRLRLRATAVLFALCVFMPGCALHRSIALEPNEVPMAMATDGSALTLVAGFTGGGIALFDGHRGVKVLQLREGNPSPLTDPPIGARSVALSGDGRTVAACGQDADLRYWVKVWSIQDATAVTLMQFSGLDKGYTSVALDDAARTVLVGATVNDRLFISAYSLPCGALLWERRMDLRAARREGVPRVERLWLSKGGRLAAAWLSDATIAVIALGSAKDLARFSIAGEPVYDLVFAEDGTTVVWCDLSLHCANLVDGGVRVFEKQALGTSALATSRDGRQVFCWSGANRHRLQCWDVASGKKTVLRDDLAFAGQDKGGELTFDAHSSAPFDQFVIRTMARTAHQRICGWVYQFPAQKLLPWSTDVPQ